MREFDQVFRIRKALVRRLGLPEAPEEGTWGSERLGFRPAGGVSVATEEEPVADLADETFDRIREKVRIWKGQDYEFSPAEAKTIRTLAELSGNKDDAVSRAVESLAYAEKTGADAAYVWNNLDDISRFWTGHAYKVDDSTFAESVSAGFDSIYTLNPLLEQYRAAVMRGDSETEEKLQAQIVPLMERIGTKGVPKTVWDHVKQVVGYNLGYIFDVTRTGMESSRVMNLALSAMAGLMVAPDITITKMAGTGIGAGIAAASAAYGTVSVLKRTKELEANKAFYDMYNGITGPGGYRNATSANLLAEVDGWLVGFLETFVDGVSSRVLGLATGGKASRIGLSALFDLTSRGTTGRWARALGDWVTGALDEGFLNEFPESVISDVRDAVYRTSVGLPPGFDVGETLSDAMGDTLDGLVVGAAYGGLGIPLSMRAMKSEAVALRREANLSLTKKDFMDATEGMKPEEVSQEDFDEARENIFAASRKQASDLTSGDLESFSLFSEKVGSGWGAEGVGKDKEGNDLLVFGSNDDLEGAYDDLRKIPGARADISKDGSHATIRFLQKKSDGQAVYRTLALTTSKDDAQGELREPVGSFDDDAADMELASPLDVSNLDRDSAVSAQEIRAVRAMLKDKYGIKGLKNKAAAQAYAVASSILHVPSLDLADRLRIIFEGDEAARAELRGNGFSEERGANGWMTNEGGGGFTIHLTRTATPATLFHETGHIVRALASADQLADVERVYGVQGHQWTRNAEERFADDFVRYLRTRQAPTAKIRYLFDQIKNLLSYITGGKYNDNLSDETARAFERLWTGKADEGVLKENGSGQKTLMEISQRGTDELRDFVENAIEKSPEAREALRSAMDSDPVYTSAKFVKWEKKAGGYIDSVVDFWNREYDGAVERDGRKVTLGRESYHSSLAHAKNKNAFWFAAFAAVPEVIKNGKTIREEANWKDRGYGTEVVAAPVQLADDAGISMVFVTINHNPNGASRMYLHKVVAQNNLRQIKTPTERRTGGNSTIASKPDSVKGTQFELAEDTPSMAEVRRKYEGTDKWMKAPNWNQTNLTERQWLQVRTPEFKKWFGDWEADPEHASKVVDGNGEPLVVYHGTGERFEVFDRSLIGENTSNDGIWGKGFYFTPDMDIAQEYAEGTEGPDAHVEGTFLKMAEPYGMDQSVLDTPFSDAELAAAKDAREKADGDSGSPYALLSYSMQDAQLVDMYRKISKGERFDGVVYRGEKDFRGFNRDEYVVPSSNQIKSATDNNGQFSAGNDSILFELADTSVRENQDGTLTVLHTLPASRIADVARIGGMPMPSLAITRPDLAPTDYGDVTLIGSGNLGRRLLSNGDIYDADMYSPTVPRPKYRLNKRKLAAADKRITSLMGRTSSFINSLSEYQYDTQEDLLALLSRDDRVQEAFLKEKGATYRLGKKKRTTILDEKAVRTIRDWAEANDVEHIDSSNEEDFRKIYMREVERIIASNADMPVFRKRILRNKPSQDAFHEVMHAGETEDDETTRTTKRNQRIAEVGGFRDWLESLIDGVYGDAYVEVPGAGNLPYTASNIIKAMEGSGRTDAAGLLAYDLGQAMSNAARPFSSREEMRGKEGLLSDARAERLDIVNTDAFFQMLEKTAREGGGNPMTARQEYFKAVGDYLKGGLESDASRMREVLSRHGFKADGAMIDATMGLVDDALQHPRKYFEAKPEQVMQFSDFQAAVVPDDISPSDEAVLRDAGLDIVHYDHGDANGQTDAVRNYTDEHQGQTLFELSEREKVNIARQVDSLTKQDIGRRNAVIDISSHTPFVFRELGFDNLKVVMYRDKLARGLYLPEGRRHGHSEGLDKGIVKKVLESFADPVYVFDSRTDDNSLVAVYDVLDKHDNPMMASVTIDKNASQVLVNLVTSIYGRPLENYQNWTKSGLLRYVDDARKDLSEAVRLQLPSVSERSFKDNLLYKSQLVNKPGAFFELAEDEEVSPKTLFELTDEQRDGFVKKWRTDVERAVRGYEVVPTRVLEQFKGEDWADGETALRGILEADPELLRIARDSDDPESFKRRLEEELAELDASEDKETRDRLEQAKASLEGSGDDDWVKRIFDYAHTESEESKDEAFVKEYASGLEGLLKLKALLIGGYTAIGAGGRPEARYPAYGGISPKVLHISSNATKEQVAEAVRLVKTDPGRYRQVAGIVERSNKGVSQAVREAVQAEEGREASDADIEKLEQASGKETKGLSKEERKMTADQAEETAAASDDQSRKSLEGRLETARKEIAGKTDEQAGIRKKLEAEDKEKTRLEKKLKEYRKSFKAFLDKGNKDLAKKGRAQAGRDSKAYKEKYQRALRKLWQKNEKLDRLQQNADFLEAYGKEKAAEVARKQSEIWSLEKELEGRRKRVKSLRRDLTAANEEARTLKAHAGTLEKRISAMRVREAARQLLSSIRRLGSATQNTDANIHDSLALVRRLAGGAVIEEDTAIEADGSSGEAKALRVLAFYLKLQEGGDEALSLLEARTPLRKWSVEQLETLQSAMREMRKDAKAALEERKMAERSRRSEVLRGFYRELTGMDAPMGEDGIVKGREAAAIMEA